MYDYRLELIFAKSSQYPEELRRYFSSLSELAIEAAAAA